MAEMEGLVVARGKVKRYAAGPYSDKTVMKFWMLIKDSESRSEFNVMVELEEDDTKRNKVAKGDTVKFTFQRKKSDDWLTSVTLTRNIEVLDDSGQKNWEIQKKKWRENREKEKEELSKMYKKVDKIYSDDIKNIYKESKIDSKEKSSSTALTTISVLENLSRKALPMGEGGQRASGFGHEDWFAPTGLRANAFHHVPNTIRNSVIKVLLDGKLVVLKTKKVYSKDDIARELDFYFITDKGKAFLKRMSKKVQEAKDKLYRGRSEGHDKVVKKYK